MLFTGLAILGLSLYGAFYVRDAVAALNANIRTSLDLATQSLAAARDTLAVAETTFTNLSGGLDTAITATASAAGTMNDSRPLIDNVSGVVTEEVPEALEGVQAALPNVIQVADVIDRTLTTLSSVGIDRQIPLPFGGSIPLRFDLGIDYNPDVPFDASLLEFQASLEGLPESLRSLEDDLAATTDNLSALSGDLQAASDNLATISDGIDEVLPLLDEYAALVDRLSATVAQVDGEIDNQLNTLRLGVMAVLLFLGLSQLAPIYLGWELVTGRRDPVSGVSPGSDATVRPSDLNARGGGVPTSAGLTDAPGTSPDVVGQKDTKQTEGRVG